MKTWWPGGVRAFEPGRRAAGQAQCRLAGRQIDDAHVAQATPARSPVPNALAQASLAAKRFA